jgi:8-oxo-dGTP pyrophosphatase MutT (NUDIX family)
MAVDLSLVEIQRLIQSADSQRSLEGTGIYGVDARCAAVLVPLARLNGDWHLVFIRRTELVEEHKGQVAFPGGACEPQDQSLEDTALREASEEIGLRAQDVRLLGRLEEYQTISRYLLTPIVGVIPWPYPVRLQPEEVSRAFTIPLAWLADRANWEERPYSRPGRPGSEMVIFYKPYDGETLWGVTGRITVNFLNTLHLV